MRDKIKLIATKRPNHGVGEGASRDEWPSV